MYISIKNKEAPFMCIIRVIHPILLSRIIFTIMWNEILVSGVYIIDTINPDIICNVKIIPSMNPIFHIYEIEVGVGRSISDFFSILIRAFFFISFFSLEG